MPEAIPTAAIAQAVRAAFGSAAHVVAAEPLHGDASSRRYVRLRLAGGAAPPTAVAMLLGVGRFPLGADEIGGGPPASSELPFVNVARWLAARGIAAPAIYHDAAAHDALVLVEDVGDTTLWAAVQSEPARAAALFGDAVDLLVALQVAGTRAPDPACHAFQQRFEQRLARWELEHFVEHGIETRHGRRLAAAERRALLEALDWVSEPFAAAEPVFAHRDFMAWNLHVQDGRLRLIDFQDALLAPEAYDLGALLTDRTTGSIVGPALEAALLERFRRARAAAGLPVRGDLETGYRLCALHRALKVIGRFHYLELVQGKPGYLAYLPGVYGVARRLLAALPAGPALATRLAPWVPELGAGA
jgi:aminoglycoside/choline kinase family phosphotransferase